MKFVLVRVGETADGALTETGRLQARAVGDKLSAPDTRASVLSSAAPPAIEAAGVIAETLGAGTPDQRRELDAPAEDGHESAMQDAWALIEAAKTALEPDATLVMVTHEVNIRLLVCRALDIPLAEMHRFALDPGSMSIIEWRTQPRERTLVASLNEVCHLEGQRA